MFTSQCLNFGNAILIWETKAGDRLNQLAGFASKMELPRTVLRLELFILGISRMHTLPALLFILLITFNADAAAEGRPANFDYPEDKSRLATLIKYPKGVTGKVSLILNCMSRIQPNGKMKDTGCYTKNQYDQTFAAEITKAAKKARLNPAVLNGRPAEIYLQFRAEFIAEGEQQNVYLYLNPGYEENVLAYGYEHVAGQRAIGKNELWNDACPNHAKYTVWARAYLSEEGVAENPTIEFGDGLRPISTCLEAIKQTIVTSQYTPASSEGAAVPSTYIEAFGN